MPTQLQPETFDPYQALAEVMEHERDRIVRLWSKQLRLELEELDIPGRDLRRPLSGLVEELARLLRDRGAEALRLWPETVRSHGMERYDQHFDADDLARELKVLEQVLFRVYGRRRGQIEPEVAEAIAALIGEATASVEASFARVLRTEEVRFKEAAVMESVLHHVEVGILLAELDGTISYATPAVGRLLGVPSRALVGGRGTQPLAAVLAQLDARHLDGRPLKVSELPFALALKHGQAVRGAWMVFRRPDGREVYVEMSATPIREFGPDGTLLGAVQTLADRTDTAQKTRELSNAYEELRRLQGRLLQRTRTQALGQLAGGAAHALNNFLNVLGLRLTMLRREFRPEHLDAMDKTVRAIGELVARLQEFSVQPAEERLAPVEADKTAHDALELVRPELSGDGRAVHLESELSSGAKVRVDETLFRELLVNLLLAALERMPGGGNLFLKSAVVDGKLELSVADSGKPYSEEERSRLFDPLRGASPAPQLALLLAVGRNHVRRWGGELSCQNRSGGEGAVLKVLLPLAAEVELPAREEPHRPALRRARAEKVLVVDDDLDNARMMAEVLADEGYQVSVANSGEEALKTLASKSFDAALLDALMPDMSGWELAREIRRRRPGVLLAMVTGADVRGQNRSTLALVDAVFRKPVEVEALDEFLSRPEYAPSDAGGAGSNPPQGGAGRDAEPR
ncbi:MAG: response regulator [Myxococcales bacterium]|nr:response regulator [Myxococcales bacterium]